MISGRRRWGRMIVVAAGLSWCMSAWPGQVLAAEGVKFGFIDYKRIERESGLVSEAAKQFSEEEVRDNQEQKALDEEATALQRSAATMSPEELKQKQTALTAKSEASKQKRAERKKGKAERQERARREVRTKIRNVVQAYAQEHGLVAVLQLGRGVVYGDKTFDITDAVIARLKQGTRSSAEGGADPKLQKQKE